MKDRSLLMNQISLCDKITHFVDEGKAVDVVCLHLSMAFDTFCHGFLLEKLAAHSWLGQMPYSPDKKLPVWLGPESGGMELHPAHGWSPLLLPKAQYQCQSCLILISDPDKGIEFADSTELSGNVDLTLYNHPKAGCTEVGIGLFFHITVIKKRETSLTLCWGGLDWIF